MNDLVLHKTSEQQLRRFLTRPSHALLLIGAEGTGKTAVATWLAGQITSRSDSSELEKYPYFRVISPEKQSISIEAVRDLQPFTKLRIPKSDMYRIILIEQAHTLTHVAQNALLKMLEEPTGDTIFILTVTNERSVLPTLLSRSQTIALQAPSEASLTEHFTSKGYGEVKIRQSYLMSGGLPGLMNALLEEDEGHPVAAAALRAREFLKSDQFQRLALVDSWYKQREDCLRLVAMIQQMAYTALRQPAAQQTGSRLLSWQRILKSAYEAEIALRNSAQPKLVLTNLALNV